MLDVAQKHLFGYLEDGPWPLDERYRDVYEVILENRGQALVKLADTSPALVTQLLEDRPMVKRVVVNLEALARHEGDSVIYE